MAVGSRLGKIEKFLLVYMVRPGQSFYPAYELHARSCALQVYYREIHSLTRRQRRNVRQVIPRREYNSLQVRFTRAMQRLVSKGYIEKYRVRPARWFGDRGRGPEPAELKSRRLYIEEEEVRPLITHHCCSRYGTVYRLTTAGREKAYEVAYRDGFGILMPTLSLSN